MSKGLIIIIVLLAAIGGGYGYMWNEGAKEAKEYAVEYVADLKDKAENQSHGIVDFTYGDIEVTGFPMAHQVVINDVVLEINSNNISEQAIGKPQKAQLANILDAKIKMQLPYVKYSMAAFGEINKYNIELPKSYPTEVKLNDFDVSLISEYDNPPEIIYEINPLDGSFRSLHYQSKGEERILSKDGKLLSSTGDSHIHLKYDPKGDGNAHMHLKLSNNDTYTNYKAFYEGYYQLLSEIQDIATAVIPQNQMNQKEVMMNSIVLSKLTDISDDIANLYQDAGKGNTNIDVGYDGFDFVDMLKKQSNGMQPNINPASIPPITISLNDISGGYENWYDMGFKGNLEINPQNNQDPANGEITLSIDKPQKFVAVINDTIGIYRKHFLEDKSFIEQVCEIQNCFKTAEEKQQLFGIIDETTNFVNLNMQQQNAIVLFLQKLSLADRTNPDSIAIKFSKLPNAMPVISDNIAPEQIVAMAMQELLPAFMTPELMEFIGKLQQIEPQAGSIFQMQGSKNSDEAIENAPGNIAR